ncbi:MAG: tetratricopeptide repeat protein [Saprospiraceae bacterium]
MLLSSSRKCILIGFQVVVFQFLALGMADVPKDSLLQLIANTEDVKKQTILYCNLAKLLQRSNVDSAFYFAQKGLTISRGAEYTLGMAEASAVMGDICVTNDQLEAAKNYYLDAVELFEKAGSLFDVTQINMILGNIHLARNEYLQALTLYQKCLDISISNNFSSLSPHLYNNIGELYLELEDKDAAEENFYLAYQLYKSQDDTFNLAMCMLNIANVNAINGKKAEAIAGYLDAVHTFSTLGSWPNIATAYNAIAELFIKDQDYSKAKEYLSLALNIIENNDRSFEGPSSIFSTKIFTNVATLAFENNDITRAIFFAKKSLALSEQNLYKTSILDNAKLLSRIYDFQGKADSALAYSKIALAYTEETQREENIKKITQLRMQYEFDAMLKEKELEEVKQIATLHKREMTYIGVLFLVVFTVILLVLLYSNQKTKAEKAALQVKNLELEKTKLNQVLAYKNKELATNMMYLLEKNEFITMIAKKLSETKDVFNKNNQSIVQSIINELKQNSSKKVWEEFEIRFKEVNADFYKTLSEKFPDLTPNEVRICAFLRLNMSTKEISTITYQSIKSIDMARFRLRKKLDIDRDENLVSFLAQL